MIVIHTISRITLVVSYLLNISSKQILIFRYGNNDIYKFSLFENQVCISNNTDRTKILLGYITKK